MAWRGVVWRSVRYGYGRVRGRKRGEDEDAVMEMRIEMGDGNG